jgi:hypothetical protein
MRRGGVGQPSPPRHPLILFCRKGIPALKTEQERKAGHDARPFRSLSWQVPTEPGAKNDGAKDSRCD